MKRSNIFVYFLFVVVLLVFFGINQAYAASKFPEKPITLIVHAGPGGGGDIFARTLAASVDKDKLFSHPLIVENKPGGSGGVAYSYVARKKKDPYFLATAVPNLLTTPIMGRIPISLKDFTPIANLAFDEYMVIVATNSKYKSMKDVIADAKANPKKVTIGGSQLGGADSICTYLIEKAAGIQLNFIVFKSGGEANAALLGGHVDMAMTNPGEALEFFKAGKVRMLGVFSENRLVAAPDVPTMKESGINSTYAAFRGVVAPADIPQDARNTLQDAMFKYTKTDIYKKYCQENMLSEAWMDGQTFGKFLNEWNGKYAQILKDMKLIQ